MDHVSKPTALFFGFLTAAMTQVSAQAAPAPAKAPAAMVQTVGDVSAKPSMKSKAAETAKPAARKSAAPRRDHAG